MHYSWNPKTKIFNVYYKGQLTGTMQWQLSELFFFPIENEGCNSEALKQLYKMMEKIEREQFSK